MALHFAFQRVDLPIIGVDLKTHPVFAVALEVHQIFGAQRIGVGAGVYAGRQHRALGFDADTLQLADGYFLFAFDNGGGEGRFARLGRLDDDRLGRFADRRRHMDGLGHLMLDGLQAETEVGIPVLDHAGQLGNGLRSGGHLVAHAVHFAAQVLVGCRSFLHGNAAAEQRQGRCGQITSHCCKGFLGSALAYHPLVYLPMKLP